MNYRKKNPAGEPPGKERTCFSAKKEGASHVTEAEQKVFAGIYYTSLACFCQSLWKKIGRFFTVWRIRWNIRRGKYKPRSEDVANSMLRLLEEEKHGRNGGR